MRGEYPPETCGSCKVIHPSVEASGIWHCPNPVCKGCGAEWFKRTLKSYEEHPNNQYSYDKAEWYEESAKYINENKLEFVFNTEKKVNPFQSKELEFEQDIDNLITQKIKANSDAYIKPLEMERNWKKYLDMKKLFIEKWCK